MKYCTKCVMPSTRPGITFNEQGVCAACQTYENRKNVDYNKRFEELKQLCNKYQGMNGPNGYDCMVAVSGGKDSHFQTYVMKELMNMTPLLVSVDDNFTMTEPGRSNLHNISDEFGCDLLVLHPNRKAFRYLMRKLFEKYLRPNWYWDRLVYTYPIQMAVKYGIELVVYGEDVGYEHSGLTEEETYSARNQINNGVAPEIPIEELLDENITLNDLRMAYDISQEHIDKIDPIFLGYFFKWSSIENYKFAKRRGFKDLTGYWRRTHCIEDYTQVDSFGYHVHSWLKYPKYGEGLATDHACRYIGYGDLTREEAIKLVKKHDHDLDPKCLQDFLEFTGYSVTEFYNILEKFYNKNIFYKDKYGNWNLKKEIGSF